MLLTSNVSSQFSDTVGDAPADQRAEPQPGDSRLGVAAPWYECIPM